MSLEVRANGAFGEEGVFAIECVFVEKVASSVGWNLMHPVRFFVYLAQRQELNVGGAAKAAGLNPILVRRGVYMCTFPSNRQT